MTENGKRVAPRNRKSSSDLTARKLVGVLVAALVVFGLICGLRALLGVSTEGGDEGAEPSPTETEQLPTEGDAEDAEAEDAEDEEEPAEEEEEVSAEPISLTITCVGDCTLGADPSYDSSGRLPVYAEQYGLDYFLQNVREVFEADDLTIVNFEGTLTTSTSRADKTYAFKGDPSYTAILTGSSVEACNLANNHSHDFGSASFTDTVTYLEEAGLITFGYESVAVTEVNGVQVGLVGIYELAKHESCSEDLEAAMEAVKELGAELIIVTFHWGNELDTVPTSTQRTLAHLAVDLGANLVVGHHPHVLQGIEEYNGVNIVYSLGNFCFGGNRNPSDYDTMIYQQTFTVIGGVVQLDLDVNIIPCSVSSNSSYNDYCPTIATGSEATRILEKIQARSNAIG